MLAGLKLYIGAALVLIVFAAGWTANGWRLGKKVDRLEVDLALARIANTELSAAVDEQHAAYRKLLLEATELKTRLAAAEARSEQVRIEWRDRIREIIRDAPPSDATCEEAVQWARVQYGVLVASWF